MKQLEDQWQEIPIDFRDKVYSIFHKMKTGEEFELSRVQPANREKFIIITKYFIKWNEGINFSLVFNKEMNKVKKVV